MASSARSPQPARSARATRSANLRRSAKASALLILAAALVGPGCVDIVGADFGRYVEREEKHFAVTGKPDVAVRTFDGSIEIRPWDKPDVQVVVEKRGRGKSDIANIEVQTQQNGNHIEVLVKDSPRRSI